MYKEYGYEFDANDTETCPIKYLPNARNTEPKDLLLVEASYMEVDGEWYVMVQDTGDYGAPPRSNIYYSVPPEVVNDTVSPTGTVINLFDYWINEEEESGYGLPFDAGINQNHALKFISGGSGYTSQDANTWTGGKTVFKNIVDSELKDGIPVLSGENIFVTDLDSKTYESSNESLAYLFDPTYIGPSSAYRRTYRNVSGLLQIDTDGYCYYDSTKNYAEFDKEENAV